MSDPLLSLGVIGVRLYDRILTSPATYPDELADHVIDEINCYLSRASLREKALLFHLACEVHETFDRSLVRTVCLRDRKEAIRLLGLLIVRAKALARHS